MGGSGGDVLYQGAGTRKGPEVSLYSTALLRSSRQIYSPGAWPATEQTGGQVVSRLLAEPFTVDPADAKDSRGRGHVRMLDSLGATLARLARSPGLPLPLTPKDRCLAAVAQAAGDFDQSRLAFSCGISAVVW